MLSLWEIGFFENNFRTICTMKILKSSMNSAHHFESNDTLIIFVKPIIKILAFPHCMVTYVHFATFVNNSSSKIDMTIIIIPLYSTNQLESNDIKFIFKNTFINKPTFAP